MHKLGLLFLSATLLVSSPALFAEGLDRDQVGRIASAGMLLAVVNAVGLIISVFATGLFSGGRLYWPFASASFGFAILVIASFGMVITVVSMNPRSNRARTLI